MPLAAFLVPMQTIEARNLIPTIIIMMIVVDYACNFPHFAYSYQLFYRGFGKKMAGLIDPPLRKNYILSGILVPVGLIVFFVIAAGHEDSTLLAIMPNIMFLTAGWHYAKQGFGTLITCSVYKKIFYTPWERRILLFNAHLVWIYAWIMFNVGAKTKTFVGIEFYTLGLPPVVQAVLGVAVIYAALALLIALIFKYKRERQLPPLSGITGYVAAIYLWIILRFGFGTDNPIHPVILFIPFFHSLQYMALVMKMKANQVSRGFLSPRQFWLFAFWGIVLGAVLFKAIPVTLEKTVPYDTTVYDLALFQFSVWIFINIHHYFIDNVIWRRESSEAKNYLFNAPAAEQKSV